MSDGFEFDSYSSNRLACTECQVLNSIPTTCTTQRMSKHAKQLKIINSILLVTDQGSATFASRPLSMVSVLTPQSWARLHNLLKSKFTNRLYTPYYFI
jgi:hypothetical protein